MVIETYLDATDLTANQSLVILDGEGKRWNVNEALDTAAARAGVNTGSRKGGRVGGARHEVILERWTVDLRYVLTTLKLLPLVSCCPSTLIIHLLLFCPCHCSNELYITLYVVVLGACGVIYDIVCFLLDFYIQSH